MPPPSATSAQRSALTSLRRIPAMKRSPAITASRRPRLRTALVGLASASAAPDAGRWRGRRPDHRRSDGSRPGHELSVPRPGSARRRGGPGSTSRAHQLLEPRRRPRPLGGQRGHPPPHRPRSGTSTHRPIRRAGLRGWVVRPALRRAPLTTSGQTRRPPLDRRNSPARPRPIHAVSPAPSAIDKLCSAGGRSGPPAGTRRRPAPTGCGCASPRSGGDHLRHAHPPALAGGRLHPVAQGGGHLVEPRGLEPGAGPGDGPRAFRIGQHRNVLVHKFRDQRYHRGEDRADARGETTVGG